MIENCRQLFMVRSVGWNKILLLVGVHMILTTIVNFVFFRYGMFGGIQNATMGLISGTLLANLFFMAIMFPLLFKWCGLKTKDLALTPAFGDGDGTIPKGIRWTLAALVIVHLATLIAIAFGAGPLQWTSGWYLKQIIEWLGRCIGQFLGNALYEEVFFRAFLLPQCLLAFKKKNRKWSWNKCFLLALAVSQTFFALSHLPRDIANGAGLNQVYGLLMAYLIGGLLFAAVFLLTKNLYAAIGVHAIANFTPMIFHMPIGGLQFCSYFIILIPIYWNWKAKQRDIEKGSATG
ncbi:MAG: lysostaphin resistance A-like protein [Aureliella sp.]